MRELNPYRQSGNLVYCHYTNPPYKTGFSLFMSCARHMTRLRAVSTSYHSEWIPNSIVLRLIKAPQSFRGPPTWISLISAVSVISILNFILDLTQRGEVYLDDRLTFLPVTDTHWRIESHLFADHAVISAIFDGRDPSKALLLSGLVYPTANLRRVIVRVVHVTSRLTIRCAHPSQLLYFCLTVIVIS